MIRPVPLVHFAAAAIALQTPVPAQPQERGPGNCIPAEQIEASRILDDETIRLEMADGPALLMHLERRCPQLRFHDFFTYEPTLGQLCAAIDSIVTRAGDQCEIARFSEAPATPPRARR